MPSLSRARFFDMNLEPRRDAQIADEDLRQPRCMSEPPPHEMRDYIPPASDNTRGKYHRCTENRLIESPAVVHLSTEYNRRWYHEAEHHEEEDAGGPGLKSAMGAFEDNWYVAAALVLTVGFGLLMTKPEGQHPGSAGDEIAEYAYLSLTLLGTINSILGVWWAGHMVPQVAWHPAGEFSKFWFASLNTSMGHGQQFAKIALEQLMLALIPLCYLQYDLKGLVLASAAVGYFILQLQTQKFLMGRMRAAYDEGVARGVPVMDDVSTLPCHCCSKAHTEGIVGLLTCQLIGTTGFMFRWLTSPSPWPLRGAKSDTSEDQNSKVESVFDLSV